MARQQQRFSAKYLFVGSVRAIDFSIADPLLGDAHLVGAGELQGGIALGRGTMLLVRVVATVVVAVAHPPLLDALAVGARELVRATRLIWGG